MKTVLSNAALLFIATVTAAPFTADRRAAYEARVARRNATGYVKSSLPRLSADYNGVEGATVNGDANVQYSSNWGGAVQIDNSITAVSATANFPSVSLPSGANYNNAYGGSAWVGIDGDTCPSAILQTGVDWVIQDGEYTYAAWYEWLPEYSYDFNIEVNPGDEIYMSVVASSATSGTAYITNKSTGQAVSHQFSGKQALCQTNAEWIVEDFQQDGSLIDFARFSPVTFSGSTYKAGGTTKGVSGSAILDIRQNGEVLTNCGTSGSETVQCSYTGN